MNQEDLARIVSKRTGLGYKLCYAAIGDAVAEVVRALSEGEHVKLRELGVLEVTEKAARKARDVARGKTIMLPPRRSVRFRPSTRLLSNLQQARRQPGATIEA